MAVLALKQVETQQDASILQARLQKETSEVKNPYKGKVIEFMVSEDMETIADLDYPARVRFEKWLPDHTDSAEYRHYLVSFDRIKQYSVSKEIHIAADGKPVRPNYENTILFLLYHPNPDIRAMFRKATKKHELAWDFTRAVPEKLKRQIFDILHYALENDTAFETRRKHLLGLRELYDFCADEKIDDIEQMELAQEQQFKGLDSERLKPCNRVGIISFCRKALFMQTEKINWNAHVWYMERFQIQPERLDAASPVSSISFTEVTHKKNRELLKKYIRYGLGITNLSVSVIRGEHSAIRNFLNDICQDENEDVCSVTPAQMDDYFKKQRQRSVQAETYNKNVMCIQHFFNFLKVRQYIERIPFDAECCLKKIIPRHLDRSVAQEAADEILEKLCCFPETIRIMYLHLWGVGLRISEVCTLKGNAYYIQGKDAWIQVYQIKMRTYKRIPIPDALYKLTKVYLKKHGIKADDYVFQNAKGGAYCKSTFRYNMLKYCELNNIQNGGYVFKSHDYRHTIATYFYDTGVSLQSIRDYLGHDYEEMTEQYIDYMPKKIEKASEEYFSRHSLAACMKRGEKTDG
ncbi:Tyrosine recombinase XerC [Clostridiales bacterium CHKCI006]|nr:Tyrosine recombinase XerC [Clostridiales bacterium CHKCI006]